MCGFSGELRWDGRRPDLAQLEKSARDLAPRGPDGDGIWAQGPVALAHRRLKIIDLSDRSSQPMVDPALGMTVVYNGAIYNYPELREELEAAGDRFFSDGDTEVILKGIRRHGAEFVERMNGMSPSPPTTGGMGA